MPSFFQSLFPCFAGGEDEQQQHQQQQSQQHPGQYEQASKPKQSPRTSSNASAYATPVPVSEHPATQKAPIYNTDKKLPPKPGSQSDSNAFELPGSSPNLFEMPAAHVPASHPLARASGDVPRQSQQSERQAPLSPHSAHSGVQGSATASSYQPSGSVRSPSERGDPDEISPVPTNASNAYARGTAPNMYSNVADALTDRKRMFERLRKTNGVDGQVESGPSTPQAGPQGGSGAGAMASQSSFTAAPVEMEAPMHQPQQQEPSELAGREHVRNPSGPKELE